MGSKAAGVAALLVAAAMGVSAGPASAEPAPPSPPRTTIDADGTYAVGPEVVAGTYASAGPVDGGTCYWKRLGGPRGGNIVENAMSKKPQLVRVDATDASFTTDGCLPWQQTDATVAPEDPPWLAGIKLRIMMDTVDRNAARAPQPPPAP